MKYKTQVFFDLTDEMKDPSTKETSCYTKHHHTTEGREMGFNYTLSHLCEK